MFPSRGKAGVVGAALAAAAILCAPAQALAGKPKKRASVQLITDTGTFGSFTPAAADPRIAAALGRTSMSSVGLRFTPSAAPGGRRAVTVAIRARATTPAEAVRTASVASNNATSVTPSAYNLGVSVGWQRFAISGDIARVDTGVLPGGREAVDVGLAYMGRKWSTRLSVGADHSIGNQAGLIGNDSAYTVDLGGTYALTHNIELNGGLRYRTQHDRLDFATDERRDSQAVYLGTAFRF